MISIFIKIFIAVLFVILTVAILRIKKIRFTKLRKKLIALGGVCIFFLLFVFPIEGNWLKFSSVEDSFQYSCVGESIVDVFYEDDCAFIISAKNDTATTVHTITKYGDEWGMVDVHSHNKFYRSGFVESNYGPSEYLHLSANVVGNEEKEKYIVIISGYFSEEIEPPVLLSSKNEPYHLLNNGENQPQTGAKYLQYYDMEDGELPKELIVYLAEERFILK